jgi:threonine/homoserine/homoserine lactone efflux protein
MTLTTLALFAAALLVNAGSPGPSIAALVARVISNGLASVLPFLAAMWIGEVLWLLAAVMGLGFLASQFHSVFLVIKYLGIAYLLFLAWKMWNAPVNVRESELPDGQSSLRMFAVGMALTVGNPKIMMFYLAVLPSLIDLNTITAFGMFELLAVAILVLMTIDLSWALAAAWARAWLKSPRAIKIANRASATAMGGAAIVIASR